MSKKIVLCGGGTAGHIMPNLALVPYLKSYFDEIHYIGSEQGMEYDIVKNFGGIEFHPITVTKLNRSLTVKNLSIPFKLLKGISQSKKIFRSILPDAIFSKGGYAALPVILAKKKIPAFTHESDSTLGLANKIISKRCKYTFTSFQPLSEKLKNGLHTGSPIRQSIYFGDKVKAAKICGFTKKLPVVLITGGSQGAKNLNNIVINSLNELTAYFNVVHIVGKNNLIDVVRDGYYQIGFTDHIEDFFALADVVVSRGGANSLFELMALKKPSLIIPLPKGNSRGDQIDNAEYFLNLGCIDTMAEEELTSGRLLQSLTDLLKDKTVIEKMSALKNIDGCRKIANIIIECVEKNHLEQSMRK